MTEEGVTIINIDDLEACHNKLMELQSSLNNDQIKAIESVVNIAVNESVLLTLSLAVKYSGKGPKGSLDFLNACKQIAIKRLQIDGNITTMALMGMKDKHPVAYKTLYGVLFEFREKA